MIDFNILMLNMIINWFIPKLIELGIMDCVWLQQDGAPAHFALPVRAFINTEFPLYLYIFKSYTLLKVII